MHQTHTYKLKQIRLTVIYFETKYTRVCAQLRFTDSWYKVPNIMFINIKYGFDHCKPLNTMVKMVVLNSTIRSTILKEIAREIKEERSAIQDTIGFATHRKTQLGREEPSDENAAAIQSLEKQIELLQEQLSQLSSAREETLQPVELTTVGLADSNGNVTVLSDDSQAYADQTIQSRQTLTLCVINTKVLEENPKSPPWRKLIFQRHNSTY